MYEIYTVGPTDTLTSIANMYETTEGVLMQVNGFLSNEVVVPGSQIVVPTKKSQPYRYYTVKKGDSLYKIAKDNGIDYSLLVQLNGLDDNDYIYPNQTLMLPNKDMVLYLTKDNDTVQSVLKMQDVGIEELMKENDKIYLRPEQILVFRKK